MKLKLSICIPTYNRNCYLRECLDSILHSVIGYENQIEIIISDNASTDDTNNVITETLKRYPWIRYYRNDINIGAERNFYYLATLAKGDYLWIFGDDDKMKKNAVAEVINHMASNYNLIIVNYSTWSKDFATLLKKCGINKPHDEVFNDHNKLMASFGLHLGYISSVIVRKNVFISTPLGEFELYAEYGFSFLYTVYSGMILDCCAVYIATPLVFNRSENSTDFDWCKYFVVGSALVFDVLSQKGYSRRSVSSAKTRVIKDCIIRRMIYIKLNESRKLRGVFSRIFFHYKKSILFWIICLPLFFIPTVLLRFFRKTFKKVTCIKTFILTYMKKI